LFVVITASVVLFGTILVDYARVAALNTMSELAVRGSVRSALSAYDAALYERYGLFGRGGTPSGEIVEKTLRGTLEYGGSDGRYRPVSPAVERFQVDAAAFLGQYGVLKRQIEEEMKIKAPIDFMLELGTRLGAMAPIAKETAATAELLAEASGLYDERRRYLLRTIALMRELAALATGSLTGDRAAALASAYSSYAGTKLTMESLERSIAAAEAASSHKEAVKAGKTGESARPADEDKQLAERLAADRRALSTYRNELSRYEAELSAAASELGLESDAARQRGQELYRLAEQSLTEANKQNEAIVQTGAKGETDAESGYDRVADALAESKETDAIPTPDSQLLADIRGSVGRLAFDDAWFVSFRELLREQIDDLQGLTEAAYRFVHASQSALSGYMDAEEALTYNAARLKQAYASFRSDYVSPGQRIESRAADIRGSDTLDTERTNDRRAAETSLHEARGLLAAASADASGREGFAKQYEQVNARYKANRLFNSAAEEAEEEAGRWTGGAEEQTKASVELVGSLFDGLADMLSGVRDSLYTGEYVVKRFRSYAPQWNGESSAAAFSYAFADQEAEYVLYGLRAPLANVSAALTEIFGLRFAIRLTEGFIECRALSHPLLILSGAMLYAAEHALADLAEMKRRGAAKLSKYANIDLTYNDYLRLFMLLHGGGTKRLSRIAAVIETNTETDLSRTPTAVAASAGVSMRLLFLPGAMRLLGTMGLLDGRVANGRYETTKAAGLSYS